MNDQDKIFTLTYSQVKEYQDKFFTLTYSQVKELLEVLDRDAVKNFINEINDQPEFLQFMGEIDSVSELIAIYQGGCASGACMPAVTYATALECMFKHYDSVESQIGYMGEITFNITEKTFSSFCVNLCSMAVEDYVQQFAEIIEVLENTSY